MDAFVLATVWLGSMVAGALLCIGSIQVVTGRLVINPRPDWTVRDIRATGTCTLIQGVLSAVYTLYGGLVFLIHAIPPVGVGHWWGLFVSLPFGLLFCITLFVQAFYQIQIARRLRRS